MISLIFFSAIILFFLVKLSEVPKYSSISKIIIIAFLIRIVLLLLGMYFFDLPDSNKDALGFEMGAWVLAQENDFLHILNSYPGPNSHFYSWIISLIYSLVGRNILIIKLIGVIISISSIFLAWLLAKKIWNKEAAIKVSWAIALFPSLILYSVLTLREVYSSFFLLVGILGLVNWIKFPSYKSLLLSLFGFIVAMHFHALLIVGSIFPLIIFSYFYFIRNLKLILKLRIDVISIFFTAFIVIFIILFFSGKLQLQYAPTFNDMLSLNWLNSNILSRSTGDASYSSWFQINSWSEFIYKLPLRIAYFLFGPFLWGIDELYHLIGALDGFIYAFFIYLIFKNIRIILKDPILIAILLILALYCIIYALGVSNFGAGIRHRSKFAIEIILLAGPLIPSLFWSRKRKVNNKLK